MMNVICLLVTFGGHGWEVCHFEEKDEIAKNLVRKRVALSAGMHIRRFNAMTALP